MATQITANTFARIATLGLFALLSSSPAPGWSGDKTKQTGLDHVTHVCAAAKLEPARSIDSSDAKAVLSALIKERAKGTTYIVHVARWERADKRMELRDSHWITDGPGAQLDDGGNPYIYQNRTIQLLGVTILPPGVDPQSVDVRYEYSTQPGKKENLTNVGLLVGAFLGVAAKEMPSAQWIVTGCAVTPDPPLPALLNLTYVAGKADSSKKDGASGSSTAGETASGVVNCTDLTSDSPCKVNRTIALVDREWWDIGLGLSLAGARERNYDSTNLKSAPSITNHVDLYGFIDLYPFAWKAPKTSAWPHIAVGIPTTGAPFHRPFFGMALPISRWLRPIGAFPFRLDLVGGFVYMRQNYVSADPAATGGLALKDGRTWKPMFGVELPLGQLVGRITKLGK